MEKTRDGTSTLAVVCITCAVATSAWAQQQDWHIRFADPGGAVAVGVITDGRGGAFVTGSLAREYATIRINDAGGLVWDARFGVPNFRGNRRPGIFKRLATGEIILAGNVHSGSLDFGVVEYSANGEQLWTGSYDGPVHGSDSPKGLATDVLGYAYVAGVSEGPDDSRDIATVKFGVDGSILWASRYSRKPGAYNYAAAVAVTDSGTVYTYGNHDDFESVLTIAYDGSSGRELWVRSFPAEEAQAVAGAADAGGNALVLGSYYGGYILVKYAPDGEQRWAVEQFVGRILAARALAADEQGFIYVAATAAGQDGDFRIVKYDPDGNEVWAASYDGPLHLDDQPEALVLDEAGNVYAAGWTETERTCEEGCRPARTDMAVLVLGPDGTRRWAATFDGGGARESAALDVGVDRFGNVFLTGWTFHRDVGEYLTVKYSQPPSACAGREGLRVTCAPKGEAHVVRARARRGAKGDRVSFCLDGQRCHETQVDYTGRAKSRWKDVANGEHDVSALWACGADDQQWVNCE